MFIVRDWADRFRSDSRVPLALHLIPHGFDPRRVELTRGEALRLARSVEKVGRYSRERSFLRFDDE